MKVNRLTVRNIGPIKETTIDLNQPLIVLYGEPRAGKSTVLNAVKWVLGGSFPDDIIKHGCQEASIELDYDGGSLSRSWYRAKSGETKARPVKFIRGGKEVDSPAAEIKRFVNPFVLDQDLFRNKTERERSQFLVDLFNVDTSALDAEAAQCAKEASELRVEIKGYGDIDLTPAPEPPDVSALRERIARVRQEDEAKMTQWHTACNDHNTRALAAIARKRERDQRLTEIKALKSKLSALESWLLLNPEMPDPGPVPETPSRTDVSDLESQIDRAAEAVLKFERYQFNRAQDKRRTAKKGELLKLEERQRKIKEERAAQLKNLADNCGVKGLAFDEEGQFLFEGTAPGMLSTSQIMRLSSALSSLYPEGFGIELLDRAESLGRSIFDYVQHAKEKKTTVLATVVGQRPAEIPASVGVFVVKDGVIFPQ